MASLQTGELPDPAATTRRYRDAILNRDLDELAHTLAPSAVLRSPISSAAIFEGREAIRDLMTVVLSVISDVEFSDEIGEAHQRVLFARARVGRETFDEVLWLRFDEQGLISELTLFIRPLPGLAALTAALAPGLAGRHGRLRATAAAALTRPLAAAIRFGDPIALRLAGVQRR